MLWMSVVSGWVWIQLVSRLTLDATHSSNLTYYDCKHVKCECIPGRMLCGEDGSIGIFPWDGS